MRLIACDIDGTILNNKNQITKRTINVIKTCSSPSSNIKFLFITGRPPRMIDELAKKIDYLGIAICSNGTLTYDLKTKSIFNIKPISIDASIEAIKTIKSIYKKSNFALETLHQFYAEQNFLSDQILSKKKGYINLVKDLLILLEKKRKDTSFQLNKNNQIIKLMAIGHQISCEEYFHLILNKVRNVISITYSNPNSSILEATSLGVNKGSSLKEYAKKLNIKSSEIIAFGDMPNDMQMLQWVGKGYAMSNSHPKILSSAKFIAPSIQEDGVAKVIEQILLNKN